MAYTLNWSDPAVKPAITLPDNTVNQSSTTLTLTGKGLAGYGLYQQENFLQLLENFASSTPPVNPTIGQQWYNLTLNVPYYWNGTGWDNQVLRSFSGPNPPASPVVGQLWYDTTTHVLNVFGGTNNGGTGWSSASPQISAGLTEYGPTPDTGTTGFASRLNRIVGAPQGYSATASYGWNQTDLVPTFTSGGTLDAASITADAHLPGGLSFPSTFDNNSWAIAISRLRKALRQVGLPESSASPVGFINDGTPTGSGNALANYYNNIDAGTTPLQGTLADILAGWNGAGTSTINEYYTNTLAALSQLETYRFSLGSSQTQLVSVATATRTTPGQSLFIPSTLSAYEHTISFTFADQAHAEAFFNAGGQIQFNPSFVPSSGSPTNIELDWKNFLLAFTGFCLDYKGIKEASTYASPSFTPTYMTVVPGVSNYYGFFDIGNTTMKIFERDVLSTPGSGLYSSDPPTDGGLVITASTSTSGSNFVLTINIEFYLQHVTTGTSGTNDTTDTGLNGSMTSNVTNIFANNHNVNAPGIGAPSVAQAGTFITAP